MKGVLSSVLRCPLCRAELRIDGAEARCQSHSFPVESGIPRLLPPDLMAVKEGEAASDLRARTYRSFGSEWEWFAEQLSAYEENFRWYFEPLKGLSLEGQVVLDAGCGMGRHTHHLLGRGAHVLAIDASSAIDVAARQNQHPSALFVQGDVLRLPVASDSFDIVCCLGVLHHVQDTEGGLRELVRVVKPGGWVLVYVYHDPGEQGAIRSVLLSFVTAARAITTRMPLGLLRRLCWLFAGLLHLGYILPVKLLSRIPGLRPRLGSLPLGQYRDYPFRVLWNDQFDRFSAPLEKRFRKDAVFSLLEGAGLSSACVLGGWGWRAAGQKTRGPSGSDHHT